MKNNIKCSECVYCRNTGRAEKRIGYIHRKLYHCSHYKAKDLIDELGNSVNVFIGFGDSKTFESPLLLKTRKKWCPLSDEDKDLFITKEQALTCLKYDIYGRIHTMNIWGPGLSANFDMDLEDIVKIIDTVKNPEQIRLTNNLYHLEHIVSVYNTKAGQWYYFDSNMTEVAHIRNNVNK